MLVERIDISHYVGVNVDIYEAKLLWKEDV